MGQGLTAILRFKQEGKSIGMTSIMKKGYPRGIDGVLEYVQNIPDGSGGPLHHFTQATADGFTKGFADAVHFSGQVSQVSSMVYFIICEGKKYNRLETQKIEF